MHQGALLGDRDYAIRVDRDREGDLAGDGRLALDRRAVEGEDDVLAGEHVLEARRGIADHEHIVDGVGVRNVVVVGILRAVIAEQGGEGAGEVRLGDIGDVAVVGRQVRQLATCRRDARRVVEKSEEAAEIDLGSVGVAVVVGDGGGQDDEARGKVLEVVGAAVRIVHDRTLLIERDVSGRVDRDDENGEAGRLRLADDLAGEEVLAEQDLLAGQRIDERAVDVGRADIERIDDAAGAVRAVVVDEGGREVGGGVGAEIALVDIGRIGDEALLDIDGDTGDVGLMLAHLDHRLVVDDLDIERSGGRGAVDVRELHRDAVENAVLARVRVGFGRDERVAVVDDAGRRIEGRDLERVAEWRRDDETGDEDAATDDGCAADDEILEAVGCRDLEGAGVGGGFVGIRLAGPAGVEQRARQPILVDDRIAALGLRRQIGDGDGIVRAEDRDLEHRTLRHEAVGRLVLEAFDECLTFTQALHSGVGGRFLGLAVERVGVGAVGLDDECAVLAEEGSGGRHLEDVVIGIRVGAVREAAERRAGVGQRLEHIALGGERTILLDPVAVGAKHRRGILPAKLRERKNDRLLLEGHDTTPRNRATGHAPPGGWVLGRVPAPWPECAGVVLARGECELRAIRYASPQRHGTLSKPLIACAKPVPAKRVKFSLMFKPTAIN